MQCQSCKKNTATIHLTELVDGVRNELHFCELCAQEQGLALKNQIPLTELLSSLLASDEAGAIDDADVTNIICPHCGITFEEFRKKGVMGCPKDYEFFSEQLKPILEASHSGGTKHQGKVPDKLDAGLDKQAELELLNDKLEAAVDAEDYEAAATLRDQIKKLETES